MRVAGRVLMAVGALATILVLGRELLERRGRANAESALRAALSNLATGRSAGDTRIEYNDFGPDELRGGVLSGYKVTGYDGIGFDPLFRSWQFDLETTRGTRIGLDVYKAPPGWLISCCARDGRL